MVIKHHILDYIGELHRDALKCSFVFVGCSSCCYSIKGISIDRISIKFQLADDMSLSLSNNSSVSCAVQEFYCYTGLKLNKSNTEATLIYDNGSLHSDDNLGITWINKPFKTLGIWFPQHRNGKIKCFGKNG